MTFQAMLAFKGHLTESEAATYCAGRFINKQSFGAFFDQREEGERNPGE